MKPHEIQEKLGLTRLRDRHWYVQPACAIQGDGLQEGLTWLMATHKGWDLVERVGQPEEDHPTAEFYPVRVVPTDAQ